MRKIQLVLVAGLLCLPAACQDYLDVNTNPNAPQSVAPNLYLSPMLHWLATAPQYDGRYVGHYTQEWYSTSTTAPATTWGKMGYDPASDNGAEQWRDVYWSFGQNLVDMMTKAEAEQRWDLLGIGYVLKAWGWQVLTDLHGEIIIKEAIDPTRFTFDYDDQQFAYQESQRLLQLAITNLQRTDGNIDPLYVGRTDKLYNGDRTKWLKLAYGLLAINMNHFSNKASYKPDSVIILVDKSFLSNADDALLQYPATSTDLADYNFNARSRNNVTLYRQTQFVVNLMNGTQFGGVVDPRMTRMLDSAADGQYRGLDVNVVGFGALATAQQPFNLFGYSGTGGLGLAGRYLFDDKSKMPIMTYSQLQFVKAEAALRLGQSGTALTAYRNGISSHIDFINARYAELGQASTQISAVEKANFLGNPAVVPLAPALTLSHIMSQKYIAQWGWGHNELWMDMRRYHYTDVDPVSGVEVFRGFVPPTTLYVDNAGKLVQRIRPRYNSEYVWNIPALKAIGGLAADYHTKPLWITQP
jgi:hypothetical protein